jgi:hypothetical protein
MLYRSHREVEYIDVVMVQDVYTVFHVSRFWSIGDKLKIGVGAPF